MLLSTIIDQHRMSRYVWLLALVFLVNCRSSEEVVKPPAPSVHATAKNQSVMLQWASVEHAVTYDIYWGKEPEVNTHTAQRITGVFPPFVHTGLQNGTTYYYSIVAIGAQDVSESSVFVSATPQPPPPAPADIRLTPGDGAVKVSWSSVANATQYAIYLSHGRESLPAIPSPNIKPLYKSTSIEPYYIEHLINGQEYTIHMSALNDSGESNLSEPYYVVPSLTLSLASGKQHHCAVRADNRLYCWGNNQYGQLGNGTWLDQHTPAEVPGDHWKYVATGTYHTCALTVENTLWCWGSNEFGQLGNPFHKDSNIPVQVGTENTWLSVAIGSTSQHTCAIKQDGTLWCWGINTFKQIGLNEEATESMFPVQVGQSADWQSVATGGFHSCAINDSHQLYCWGTNFIGQLGNEAMDGMSEIPTLVLEPEGFNTELGWRFVSLGLMHSCATDGTGTMYCWGTNTGELVSPGDNAPYIPKRILSSDTWIAASNHEGNTCAITTGQSLWCWGNNYYGAVGIGTYTNSWIPALVDNTFKWSTVGSGDFSSCATRAGGEVYCWGTNVYGELGLRSNNLPYEFSRFDAGHYHNCAQHATLVLCWGDNSSGQLGTGNKTLDTQVPVQVLVNEPLTALSTGYKHSCIIKQNGSLGCWGSNAFGQLGLDADITRIDEPSQVGTETDWLSLSLGKQHSCAINLNSELYCWGDNTSRQLGIDSLLVEPVVYSPQIVMPGTGWKHVSTNFYHTCAIDMQDKLRCWGDDQSGQISNLASSSDARLVPNPQLMMPEIPWMRVATAEYFTCAISMDRQLYCWGHSDLTNADSDVNNNPLPIGNDADWEKIEAGSSHACAIKRNGTLWCWGNNFYGEVIPATHTDIKTLTQVFAETVWRDVKLGTTHSCAISEDGFAHCWGNNISGQLGNNAAWRLTPSPVMFSD